MMVARAGRKQVRRTTEATVIKALPHVLQGSRFAQAIFISHLLSISVYAQMTEGDSIFAKQGVE